LPDKRFKHDSIPEIPTFRLLSLCVLESFAEEHPAVVRKNGRLRLGVGGQVGKYLVVVDSLVTATESAKFGTYGDSSSRYSLLGRGFRL
jgi:hypothetical protein